VEEVLTPKNSTATSHAKGEITKRGGMTHREDQDTSKTIEEPAS